MHNYGHKATHTLRLLFQKWEELPDRDKHPKYTEWENAFVDDHSDYPTKKDY